MASIRKNRIAVTLLELAIVLLVIGLMAAVAAPRFGQAMRGVQSRAVAIQIAAHLNYVRRTAINQGQTTTLTFAATGSGYTSTDVTFPDRVEEKLRVNLREMFDPSVSAIADFDSATQIDASTITFDPEGVPHVGTSAMHGGMITVSSPGAPSQYLVIAAGTGTVTIYSAAEMQSASVSQSGGGGS
ncbi:MAG: GspH/FimT family pseudopilin [Pirellulaceae bacterium]